MKKYILLIPFLWLFYQTSAQNYDNLLDDPQILRTIDSNLRSIYSFNFDRAKKSIPVIENKYPNHPTVPFLKAFYIYWKYFPLTPDHPKAEVYVALMEEVIMKAQKRLEKNENDKEGVFFDLFGRAFYVMFWSDNGKPGKVFPHLNSLYHQTKKGFDMKNEFNEFYFSSGLYNYYIESYPEKHPAYKPVALLFREGDRIKGLRELLYCADNSIYLKTEARFFLSLLYLNYENDFKKASEHAAMLYREFPDNPFYAGKYLEILMFDGKFFFAPAIIKRLREMGTAFAIMQAHLYQAYYLEKKDRNYKEAFKMYRKAIDISKEFGEFSSHYQAIAFMGMGRISKFEGKPGEANRYFRMANKETVYEYITEDQ